MSQGLSRNFRSRLIDAVVARMANQSYIEGIRKTLDNGVLPSTSGPDRTGNTRIRARSYRTP